MNKFEYKGREFKTWAFENVTEIDSVCQKHSKNVERTNK